MDWAALGSLAAAATVVVMIVLHFDSRREQKRAKLDDLTFKPDLTIEDFKWVENEERNWSYEQLLQRLIDLDRLSIKRTEISDEIEGTIAQWVPVFRKSKDTWRLVVYKDSLVVGYWHAVSLNENLLDKLLNGTMLDSDIVESQILNINEPKSHNLYFTILAIHPDFKFVNHEIKRKLNSSMALFYNKILDENIDIECIYASAFSEEGIVSCQRFDMIKVTDSVQGPVFAVGFSKVAEGRIADWYQARVQSAAMH